MDRIAVRAASASYEVVVGGGCLERAGELIAPVVAGRKLFLIADEGAWAAQGGRITRGLAGLDVTALRVRLGEERKRLATVEELSEKMHAAGADRGAVVLAFGGGIAGDVGGFVAASYMRGVDVIQIPTTLLAQVDAAVGGKTGVNLATGKNLVGAFHQPRMVLMDTSALLTLPEREFRAGLFEVLKHGVIRSRELFDLLVERREDILARRPEMLQRIVADSVRIKADVVEQDEREGGLRRILNYGHTLGHALEAETQYSRLLHGEAVAWGMIAAGRLGEALGMFPAVERERVERLILDYGPLPSLDGIDAAQVAPRVSGDKKTIGGKTHFVLPTEIGKVQVVVDPPSEQVLAAARAALEVAARAAAVR